LTGELRIIAGLTGAPPNLCRPDRQATEPTMNETPDAAPLPDRLSTDPRSPHHVAAVFEREIGIRLNGRERFDVEEYCISEGWVRVTAGNAKDRYGNPLTIKVHGPVEPYFRDKTES